MKKMSLTVLATLFAASSFAAEYRVQKVKVLGPMKNTVIFQSTDLKKVKKSNVLKGKLVVQWGLHVYEVVNGLYACNAQNVCKLSDFERVASFEKCEVKNKTKVVCSKRLAGSTGSRDAEVTIQDGPDYSNDDYRRERRFDDEQAEFPVRVPGEFDDVVI